MKEIIINTDGGTRNNQCEDNLGAYAYHIKMGEYEKEFAYAEQFTTNNIQEMKALIEALKCLKKEGLSITVKTDSNYVIKGCTEWLKGWKRKNWKNSKGLPVKNKELWEELDRLLMKNNNVKFVKVKGHSGDYWNEYVDDMVNVAMDKLEERLNEMD